MDGKNNLTKACIDYLVWKGYVVLRNNTGAIVLESPNGKKRLLRFGALGSPDIIACSPEGKFVAVECKTKKGKLTAFQEDYLNRLKQTSATVVVARSIDDLVRGGL